MVEMKKKKIGLALNARCLHEEHEERQMRQIVYNIQPKMCKYDQNSSKKQYNLCVTAHTTQTAALLEKEKERESLPSTLPTAAQMDSENHIKNSAVFPPLKSKCQRIK